VPEPELEPLPELEASSGLEESSCGEYPSSVASSWLPVSAEESSPATVNAAPPHRIAVAPTKSTSDKRSVEDSAATVDNP
jgi:hypothetical protein